jgi:L-alanine-DL-glutamate epimerase-like enolase superfamily enzyme
VSADPADSPTLWSVVADLPVQIDGYELEGLTAQVSSDFDRHTTVIHLHGGGKEGIGEDVTYDLEDHDILQAAGPILALSGAWTIGSFSDHVGGLDTFPQAPQRDVSRRYRRWAFESAALDLALRQAGVSLHEHFALEARPVTFVVSLRLGEPPSLQPLRARSAGHPALHFKLDATSSWDDDLVAALVQTGAVDSIDLKGHYVGSSVDQGADAVLYRRIAEGFPQAWIEDPMLTEETDAVLAAARDRFAWDAPIHSVEDIEALAHTPGMVNIKPSRLGGLRSLLDAYDYCNARGIGMYGGGQFELGPGRGQNQYLASLWHPDGPNDVAPTGYNLPEPPPGLPDTPLPVAAHPTGFRWG